MTLIEKLGAGLQRLADASPDGVRYINDMGFSARDLEMGMSLAASYPNWSETQARVAHKIAATYRMTQLADLEIPPYVEDAAPAAVREARIVEAAKLAGLPEWGIRFSEPRTVNTRQGLRVVRSGPANAAFWADWKANKESLKARGYSATNDRGTWMVVHWGQPTSAPAEEPQAPRPVSVEVDPRGLLAYQVPAVRALVRSLVQHGAALDASDTGTGKTFAALGAARTLGLSPLIIAPKAVLESWRRAAKHIGIPIRVVNYEKVRNGNTPYGRWETVVGQGGRTYDKFAWASDIKMLVFDEVHRCKGTKTQNSQLVIGARMQRIPTIAASATAAVSPLEMKALGFLLGLHNLRDFYQWAESHGAYRNRWDGWEFTGGPAQMSPIHQAIFPDRGYRVRVADLGDQFPVTKIVTDVVEVESPEKVAKAYAAAAEALDMVWQRSKRDKAGAEHLTRMLRARQISEIQKLPIILEMASDALEQGRSVMIAVNFDDSITSLLKTLEKLGPVVVIRGGQTDAERTAAIDAFQSNRVRVIVINTKAGGVGVSLHDLDGRFPRTAIISPSWSAVELKQVLGRVWRAGGRSGSVQYLLYAAGTVEERVAELVEKKISRLTAFNDGLAELEVNDNDLG